MRKAFSNAVLAYSNDDRRYFLTGDLGFMALEDVQAAYGERFINAGVAEQNMIGVAAGLAREGMKVLAYSIAPFCYARPFEQIRNDICLSDLPVLLVGNGGGYAYGYMGPTHHALEDCASMLALGVRVFIPAFDVDIPVLIESINKPTYMRLGYEVRPESSVVDDYAPWRKVLSGGAGVLVALGPLAGVAWCALNDVPLRDRPSVWAVTEFPLNDLPLELLQSAESGSPIYVIEEHVLSGGLGMQLMYALANRGLRISNFVHRYALGYPGGRYGSQAYHRGLCGLDESGIKNMIASGTAQ